MSVNRRSIMLIVLEVGAITELCQRVLVQKVNGIVLLTNHFNGNVSCDQ